MLKEPPENARKYLLPIDRKLSDFATDKIHSRKKKARLRFFLKFAPFFKSVFFLLALIAMFYFSIIQLKQIFFHTSYFDLRTINVEGNQRFSREEIILKTGIAPGQNALLINKEQAEEHLLEEPQIKSASVSLSGLRNLNIKIEERIPYLILKVGINFYEVDYQGIIISTNALMMDELPLITGIDLSSNLAGDSLEKNDSFFMARLWVDSLGKESLEKISEINFSSLQNPYVFLVTGEKIYPDSLDDFKKRFNYLCSILDNLRKNNVEPIYLDMRSPNHIVVRPKKKQALLEGSMDPIVGG